MPIDPGRVEALFRAAIGRTDPAERRAFLDREAGDDAELRAHLDTLLDEADLPPDGLDRPLIVGSPDIIGPEPAALSPPPGSTQPGGATGSFRDVVGPSPEALIAGRYKVRQEIGEGGMGTVYLAEQVQPVRRQVALKLIKTGMDTRAVLARFESERQALALMDHPNIAKVLDAGTTEHGRPFFVMELVKGMPLTDYCDRHHLGLPERLSLLRQICSAVQHAHQKGIIHRDLKPTNILVEEHDGKPVPKVIDFGLAKATSGMPLTDRSLYTALGSVAGTPLYMAPEQASFSAFDIDTRADIYALGVILYELLTGSTPIRRETMKRAALDEMLRVIREDEPPTPSSRISTSEGLPSLAANRHIEPARLSRFVRGDLDWIVMKALAKERSRRYDSAIGLANDIERFTNHEPVSAGPPTAGYRLRKFVRRNRGQVAAASLVLLALIGGIIGTTLGLREARNQEEIAIAEAVEKEEARRAEADQRLLAEARRQQAEKRLAQVAKMNAILGAIFKDLDPRQAEKDGKPLSAVLGERLDRAAAEIEGDATGDPLAVAAMQRVLGESLVGLGFPRKAVGVLTKALATLSAGLGPDHPDTLTAMNRLGLAYQADGQLDRAVPMLEKALAASTARLGAEHPDTLTAKNSLAGAYHAAGQLDRALPMFEEVLAAMRVRLGPDHPETLDAMNNLGWAYQAAGQLGRALPMFEAALVAMKGRHGPDHPSTLSTMNNLGLAYHAAGQLDRAVPLFEGVLMVRRAKLGPDHPDTLNAMNSLAGQYQATGQLDRAVPMLEAALAARRAKLGTDHPDTLNAMNSLAGAYQAGGRLDRAVPLLEEALALMRAKLGPEHPDTLNAMNNLAFAYQATGRLDRAVPLLEEALAGMRSKLGPDHPGTLNAMTNLATAYQAGGRLDLAVPLFEEALAATRVKFGSDHPKALILINYLAPAYYATGKVDRAVPLWREAVALGKRRGEADPSAYAGALAQLARGLVETKQWPEAEAILRESLAIREAKEPDDWKTFNTRSMLGGALLGQGKPAEAEPYLRSGHEGMARRAGKIPPVGKPRIGEALDRLIAFGEATGKADEVAAWKAEKAKLVPKPEGEKK